MERFSSFLLFSVHNDPCLTVPECSPAVECHHCGEILQLLTLLCAHVGNVLGAGDAELVGLLVVHDEVGQQGDHVHGERQVLIISEGRSQIRFLNK